MDLYLKKEYEIDFSKPFEQETLDILSMLISGCDKDNYVFYFENKVWHYFNSITNGYDKFHVNKYAYKEQKKLDQKKAEFRKAGKKFVYIEDDDGALYNIGNQILHFDEPDALYIRIVPYGLYTEENTYITIGEYAYYLIYNKKTRSVEIQKNSCYNIKCADGEFKREYLKNDNCDTYNDYWEDMEFGYDLEINSDSIHKLYQLINQYEPHVKELNNSLNIIKELFNIKRQIEYPVYANNEAVKKLSFLEKSEPEELINMGFDPKKYDIKECFGIDIINDRKMSLEDIKYLLKWKKIVTESASEGLINYYCNICGIEIDLPQIELFLELFEKSKEDVKTVIKYVLRGVAEEHLDLSTVIRNTISMIESNEIKTWNGRYSAKLIRRHNMRNYSKLDTQLLDSLERKPTLDNLYKMVENL